jgi:hypothetical protein
MARAGQRRGYSRHLAVLAPLTRFKLLTLYVQAYPEVTPETASGMSRDALIAGLLEYVDRERT